MDLILKRLPSWVWDISLLALAIALPYLSFMDRSRTSLAVLAGIYVILGLSLNIIVGYAGLFQLGHAAFFGLGAYTAAILSLNHDITMLATIPVAALVAGGAAILVSKPILHLRGDYLCIVTIAFGEIFRIAVTNNIFGITGGANGLFGAGRPEFPLPWLSPVPEIMLALFLLLHVYLTRRSGPVLQWGGAGVIGLAYYLPPVLLDHKPLLVISMLMGLIVLAVGAMLRDQRTGVRGQIAALMIVVAVFVLLTAARADHLAAGIDGNIEKYFKVGDPVKVLGVDLTPVTFKRDARPYYFLVLGFIIVTIVGMRRLQNSRLGRAWLYVREDQLAAEAMGIDTTQVKLTAFAVGSAWAGVAGVLYASRFTVVAPESFNFLQSVVMFCIVVLGGSGSIPGVLIGTLGMVVLPELMRDVAPTFLYKGSGPVIILAVILGSYLYSAQRRLPAAVESGAMAAAFFVPPLVMDEPSLYVAGIIMVLAVLVVIRIARLHTGNMLPWGIGALNLFKGRKRQRTGSAQPWVVIGALSIYTIVILAVGKGLGPDLEREISAFRIMDWRDGLMGLAMVIMMVLRPAGIIPERRQGVLISAAVRPPETGPAAAIQQTM
jgi:ABC-type branched-subunit amino acid transport system permease subunit